jgi:hypothetical protein
MGSFGIERWRFPPGGLSHPDPDMTYAGKCGRRRRDGNEKQRCDGMETRGRCGLVEKMGNEAMNCLAQGNKWKLALGRGGGVAVVHCTRSGNNILSPRWALIAAGFLPASATPYKACARSSKLVWHPSFSNKLCHEICILKFQKNSKQNSCDRHC